MNKIIVLLMREFMRKEIEKFCDAIKVDYFLYLYNKGESLAFPKCCKL